MRNKFSDYFKPSPKQKELLDCVGSGKHVFFGGARGGGKMSSNTSLICTPYGFRQMGDLKVGDTISNPNGSPQKVIQIYEHPNKDIYEIEFEDGAKTEVGLEHLWLVRITSSHQTKIQDNEYLNDEDFGKGQIVDTQFIINWLDKKSKSDESNTISKQHICIPLTNPVRFTKAYKYDPRTIEPYILGVLIGDGCLGQTTANRVRYTGIDKEIDEKIVSLGYKVVANGKEKSIIYEGVGTKISNLNLRCTSINKFIPEAYKYDTVENRIQLVQGLMDTDGYVDDRGHMSYTTISQRLASDFQFLIRSLGGKANIVKDKAGYRDKDGAYIQCNDAYTVYFNTKINRDLVSITRKKDRCKDGFNNGVSELQRRIVSCKLIGKKDARCITVSHPNSLYICDDFIVTHNTHGCRGMAVRTARAYPGISIVCIRKTYDELKESFINKILEEYPAEVFKYRYTQNSKTCKFANGSRIIFKSCETEKDARKIQGLEYQLMIIDEAPLLQAAVITRISGSLRRNVEKLPDFIPTLIMTGNPGGISDYWFKTRFINPDISVWTQSEIDHLTDKRKFISAKVTDNAYIGDEYIQLLSSISDENLREAWLNGNWDVWDGQFFTQWNEAYHVIEPFSVPESWLKWGAMDLGFSEAHPTTYLEFTQDPQNNCIYIIKEYTGVGSSETYIRELKEIIDPKCVIYADPSMFKGSGKETDMSTTPAMMFLSEGISLVPANNERVNGWRAVKSWLGMDETHRPNCMIFNTCTELIRTIPLQMYSKRLGSKSEDLDTKGEDDWVDSLRYGLFSPGLLPSIVYIKNASPVNIVETLINVSTDRYTGDSTAFYEDIFSADDLKSYY